MRCFLINLKNQGSRLEFMSDQLASMEIPFERFEAIDASILSQDEINNFCDSKKIISVYKKKFTRWEIWCALSHRAIYQKMIDENIEECLILEDDIIFDQEKFINLYRRVSENKKWEYLSVNYDIFDKEFRQNFFKYQKPENFMKNIILTMLMYAYIPLESLQQYIGNRIWSTIMFSPRPLHLSWVYFLRKEGAKKLLNISSKITCPADYLQNQARIKKWLKLYFVSPQIVRQYREKFGSSTRK